MRKCFVKGKPPMFHEWSHVSQISEAILKGTVSGVVSNTFGIVEYEDGQVDRVYPEEIKFTKPFEEDNE